MQQSARDIDFEKMSIYSRDNSMTWILFAAVDTYRSSKISKSCIVGVDNSPSSIGQPMADAHTTCVSARNELPTPHTRSFSKSFLFPRRVGILRGGFLRDLSSYLTQGLDKLLV